MSAENFKNFPKLEEFELEVKYVFIKNSLNPESFIITKWIYLVMPIFSNFKISKQFASISEKLILIANRSLKSKKLILLN